LPYEVAFSYARDTVIFEFLQEMQAMSFRRGPDFALLLLVMAACFGLGRSFTPASQKQACRGPRSYPPASRRGWFRPLLLGIAAMVSFRALRDVWFVCMVAGFLLAEAARERRSEAATQSHGGQPAREVAGYGVATVAALVLAFVLAMHHGLRFPDMAREVSQEWPVGAADFVRDSHFKGPIYNSFNWGGFLIYYLPQQPVAIDPRTDLYGTDLFVRSLSTDSAVNWKTDPDLARANVVIMERWRPLVAALATDPQFRTVYADTVAVVFVRQGR
jgi:hypothetical protein